MSRVIYRSLSEGFECELARAMRSVLKTVRDGHHTRACQLRTGKKTTSIIELLDTKLLMRALIRCFMKLGDMSGCNYCPLIEGLKCAGPVCQGVGRIRHRLQGLVETPAEFANETNYFCNLLGGVQCAGAWQLRTSRSTSGVIDLMFVLRTMQSDAMYVRVKRALLACTFSTRSSRWLLSQARSAKRRHLRQV